MEQLPPDQCNPSVINLTIHMDAIAWTDFDNFGDKMNPWNIWFNRLKRAKKEDLELVNSEGYKKRADSFHYDEVFYHQNIHNPQFAAYLSAVFSKVENHLKKLLKIDDYTFKRIYCVIKEKGINLKKLKEFDNIELLRLYNNAYKHNDMCMTKELQKTLKTNQKGIIDYTVLNMPKFINSCYEFLWDLEQKLIEIRKQEVKENDL
jgi:hypothetical protein